MVPPSGGSLEIGNGLSATGIPLWLTQVPPSGGSLEIGNILVFAARSRLRCRVPPSGGSLEIGNGQTVKQYPSVLQFPLRGDP